MKRKISLVILTAALAVASAIGFAACGDEQTKPCAEHSWDGGRVTRAATCAAAGETTFTCTVCGEKRTEEIAKLTTHSWDEGEVHQPDITAEGTITYTCTVCGETYSDTVPAHTEHEWDEGSQLKAPTCAEKGSMKYECEICHTTKTEDIPATGEHHFDTFVETVTKPTCVHEGSARYRCTTCENTAEKPVEATGKHALAWAFEGNEHWQACSNDGCSYATEKTPHGESDWTQTNRREPDCANDGRVDYECKCGATKYETLTSTREHHFELKETTKEATCGEAGSGLYECSGCHNTQTQEIPATGKHTFRPKFTDTQHYTECSVCHTETAREDHSLTYVVDKQATLFEAGTRHRACPDCEYRENDESYEPDGFVSDYRKGVNGSDAAWTFGRADVKWGDTSGNYVPMGGDSFEYIKGEKNGDAFVAGGVEIKEGWIGGKWSVMEYTASQNADLTIALKFRHAADDSSPNVKAIVRVQVVGQDGTAKQYEFLSLNGSGDGAGDTRALNELEAGDKIYVVIDFEDGWEQGDVTCRILEAQAGEQ